MPTKNWDLEKPLSIKLDAESERALRQDAEAKTIPISALLRSIVRQHYKLHGSRKKRA